ncbi:hypothetical protein RI129_009022 [Pyrocoelia pectoralis]|uniref:UDP-glucuronosyltransferase n=1 Tax=Pyrocoelia pectoralis TaxID=417401 RepID=A0AAN7V6N1_9COLE
MSMSSWFNDIIGLPAPPSYSPHPFLKYSYKMTFWQRFHNTFVYALGKLLQYLRWYPTQEMLLKKYFPGAPSLDDVHRNVSLFLYNGHLSLKDVEPNLPNAIDIAGYYHIYPPKALPSDLQILLDNATDGAIYFSMGSILNSKGFPRRYQAAILKVFSELKQQILWKWEEDLQNGPTNVFTKAWFPQQDVLVHPNVVLFITHGGAMSSIEAIYYGKPLLVLPTFSDQGSNAAKAQQAGYGKFIPFEELTEENFREQLNELLNNPVYVSTLSNILIIVILIGMLKMLKRDQKLCVINH